MQPTWVLIPAAGDSRRMGRPKALLPLGGRSAFEQVFAEACRAGCAGGTLLVGEALDAELGALPAGLERVVVPEDLRKRGPIGSLVAGLPTIPEHCTGVLIWPVDHLFVGADTARQLLATSGRVRQPKYEGRSGHPIWLDRDLLDALPEHLERGSLRTLLATVPEPLRSRVPVPDFAVTHNCNTAEDYDSGLARWRSCR